MAISYRHTLFNGASLASSTYTSNAFLVSDWAQIGVQVPSLASAAGSRFTFWVSDADNPVEAEWTPYSQTTSVSQLTVGHRWLRCTRSAVDSQGTVYVNGASNW
jgi:hypothetical protein